MSNSTRLVLRNPVQLSDVLIPRLRPIHSTGETEVPAMRFWRLWESRNSVLIGAQAVVAEPAATNPLTRLQGRLTTHFIQLTRLERSLFVRAHERRGSGARTAVRQMEMERRRLGRELHTGAGQTLAAIRLHLEAIASEMPSPSPGVAHALNSISALAADTLEQVRGISRRLHPPEWQRLTLQSAIRQLWEISGVPQRFKASLEIALPWEPELEVKVLIYRALQEALSNLVRHSRATQVRAAVESRDGRLVLSICDNGVGFDPGRVFSAPASVASGIGLRSVQEMAQTLGGKLDVESGPHGTRLLVSVPPFPIESERPTDRAAPRHPLKTTSAAGN